MVVSHARAPPPVPVSQCVTPQCVCFQDRPRVSREVAQATLRMTKWEVDADPKKYVYPKLRPEVNALGSGCFEEEAKPLPPGDNVYPFLGTNTLAKLEPSQPIGPMVGPSKPQCGHRLPLLAMGDEFKGLSPELADYNYKRTGAIMKGAKPGC